MRRAPLRMTLPISRAATRYCRAVAWTAARREAGVETTARAPPSENRANSAGSEESSVTVAPSAAAPFPGSAAEAAKQDSASATAALGKVVRGHEVAIACEGDEAIDEPFFGRQIDGRRLAGNELADGFRVFGRGELLRQ